MRVRNAMIVAVGLMIALSCQTCLSADPPKKTNPANDSVTGPSPGMTYGPTRPAPTPAVTHHRYHRTTSRTTRARATTNHKPGSSIVIRMGPNGGNINDTTKGNPPGSMF